MSIRWIVLLVLVLASGGCATIVHGTTQEIAISCTVPTAEIAVDGVRTKAGTVELERGCDHIITAQAEGYETERVALHSSVSTGWALAETIFGLAGFVAYGLGELVTFIPLIVDSCDGAIESFDTESVVLKPRKIDEFPPVPTASVDPDELARFCSRCGSDFPKGSRFCPQCGTPRQVTRK